METCCLSFLNRTSSTGPIGRPGKTIFSSLLNSAESGYLDGFITAPTTFAPKETIDTTAQTTALTSQAETPWHSLDPSPAEWKTRNAWTKDFLIFNTKNSTGLGIDTSGSAADTWKSYINGYGSTSSMARWSAERELRNLTYSDSDDFPNHIAILRNKLYNANALGAGIMDESFKTNIQTRSPIPGTLLPFCYPEICLALKPSHNSTCGGSESEITPQVLNDPLLHSKPIHL